LYLLISADGSVSLFDIQKGKLRYQSEINEKSSPEILCFEIMKVLIASPHQIFQKYQNSFYFVLDFIFFENFDGNLQYLMNQKNNSIFPKTKEE
jgi:hypothetical protein